MNALQLAEEAGRGLRERAGRPLDVAVVLGSGWATAAEGLGAPRFEVATDALPGFVPPTAPGHRGTVRLVEVGGISALLFTGRVHLYEGRTPGEVAHAVRTAAAAGVRCVVLTNAAGGLRTDWPVGTVALIADHINLTGTSPIEGANFVDMTDTYTRRLREVARAETSLPEGVYCGFRGPQFETPAEIRMARALGADLVGMSTVLEAIAAREAGVGLLGLSLVTNFAAGMSDEPLSGEDVVAAARAAVPRLTELLRDLLPAVARA